MNSWIQVFRPVLKALWTPRLSNDRGMILSADTATLEAIARGGDHRAATFVCRVSSRVSPMRWMLNVSTWETVAGPAELYLGGTTRLIDGVVYLELPGGFPIEIANPPADLPMDTTISMMAWSVRLADDGVSAITDWVLIDLLHNFPTDPGVAVEDPFSNITGVTINKVELVYQFMYSVRGVLSRTPRCRSTPMSSATWSRPGALAV